MKRLSLLLVSIVTLLALTFGCKIYNHFDPNEVLNDPAKGNIGKDKYVTKDGKSFATYQEYLDGMVSAVKFVDVAADGSAVITLILNSDDYTGGFSGSPLYLYGNEKIVKRISTYSSDYGTGARDPGQSHGTGAFALFNGPSPFLAGTHFVKYTLTIPAPDATAIADIDELIAASDDYKTQKGVWVFHFAANNPGKGKWDGASGLFREFYKGNKSGTCSYLRGYAPGYIGNDGTGFAQLRLDYTNLAGGCKVSLWKGYSD